MKYPEYVLDHFQNLINFPVVHNLPVPRNLMKTTHWQIGSFWHHNQR